MNDAPLVSIIMNCYNCDRFLQEAIDSVYAQTYKNWEIIFWNNHSTDKSAKIAGSYNDKLKYYFAESNTPLGEARNLALAKARGKYIAFLDCDDIYLPKKLESQIDQMEKSEYALSYGSAIIIDEKGKKIRNQIVKNKSGMIFSELLSHYEINMQSVILSRDVLIKENLKFDEKFKYCPDYNLFMKIAAHHPVGVIDGFLVKYRLVSNSLSKQTVDIAAYEIRETLDKIFKSEPKLKVKYAKSTKSAYEKLHYYEAIAAIQRKDRISARKELYPVIFSRWQYLILYLLLVIPVPNGLIQRLLRR